MSHKSRKMHAITRPFLADERSNWIGLKITPLLCTQWDEIISAVVFLKLKKSKILRYKNSFVDATFGSRKKLCSPKIALSKLRVKNEEKLH